MNRGGGGSVGLIIGLVVGNVLYLLFTLILSVILEVTPTEIFSGPFSATANNLISAWVAIGGLLGVVDVLMVVGFITSLTSGW